MDIQKKIEKLEQIEDTDIRDASVVNVLMNKYTLENVAFGELKHDDKIPFDSYVKDLSLQRYKPYSSRYIEGDFITRDERVVKRDEEHFISECFAFHFLFVFMNYPSNHFNVDDMHEYSKFIMELYPLFKQIINTEVEPIDIVPVFKTVKDEAECYEGISKFLMSIAAKGLRKGGCVNKYVKHLPYIPYYVGRLLRVENDRYYLENNNTDSLDYKLAVLSAIHFMKWEHTKLFELKTQKWESLNN